MSAGISAATKLALVTIIGHTNGDVLLEAFGSACGAALIAAIVVGMIAALAGPIRDSRQRIQESLR